MPIEIPYNISNTQQQSNYHTTTMWNVMEDVQQYTESSSNNNNNNNNAVVMDSNSNSTTTEYYDITDPAYEAVGDASQDEGVGGDTHQQSRLLSQDEQIKAYEVTLRNAELFEKQELERSIQQQQLVYHEEQTRLERERQQQALYVQEQQSRLEQERMYQIAQLELAQLEEERWRRLQILHQQQQQIILPTQRKSVGFADSALLYSSDRTIEEVNCMWYSKDELATFKNERKVVVKALKRANFNVISVERSGKYCLRGYEAYFSLDVNKAMKDARTLVTSLVLTEQERQRSLGLHDDEAIRFACSSVSQWACDNAAKLGEKDEVDTYGVYDSEYDMDYTEYNNIQQSQQQQQQQQHRVVDNNEDITMENYDTQQYESNENMIDDDDNLEERLQSALKLVRALRSGTQSSSSSHAL